MDFNFVYLPDYKTSEIIDFEFCNQEKTHVQIVSKVPANHEHENKIYRHFAIAKNVNINKAIKDFEKNKSKGLMKLEHVMTKEYNDGYYSLFEVKIVNYSVIEMFGHLNESNVDARTTKEGDFEAQKNT